MTDLIKEWLTNLSYTANRSLPQMIELYELCDGDLAKLLSLEERIKNNHVGFCPSNREEVDVILKLPNEHKWFGLDEFRIVKNKRHNTCIVYRNEQGTKFDLKAVPPTTENRIDYFWRTARYCGEDRLQYAYNVNDDKQYRGVKIRIENGKMVLPLNVYENLKTT